MAPKAMLFDVGNVILALDFKRMLGAFGLHTPDEHQAMESLHLWEPYDRFERGHLDETGFRQALEARLGTPLSPEDFERHWNSIFLGEVPRIEATLARLQPHVELFALTNISPTHLRYIERFPSLKRFRKVFSSCELGFRKPEPESFLHCLREMGRAPQEVLFLDDRQDNVDGAAALGLQVARLFSSAEAVIEAARKVGVPL